MKHKIIYISILTLFLLNGCDFIHNYQLGNAVAKVGNEAIYDQDIQKLTKGILTQEDSIRIVNNYIEQWAIEHLEYERAIKQLGTDEDIEQMVAQYRRKLYTEAYERELIAQKMSHALSEDSIQMFYENQAQHFILHETLLKGLLLIIPIDAPDQAGLHKNLSQIDDESLEYIEKYAYQYSIGYELFTEQWQIEQNILLVMPIDQQTLTETIRHKDIVELSDSTQTYILRITEKHFAGEQMPLDYAKPKIEELLLAKRKQQFIQRHRQELLQQSRRLGKLTTKQTKQDE